MPERLHLALCCQRIEQRCTLRWLLPSAKASAELDHASPSASKANTAEYFSSTGGVSSTTSGETCVTRANRAFGCDHVGQRFERRAQRPISTRSRARWDSSLSFRRKARAMRISRGTSPGQASASMHASVNSTGPLRQGNRRAHAAHDVPTGIHHQRCRGEQRLHFVKQQGPLPPWTSDVQQGCRAGALRFRPPPIRLECRTAARRVRP
jgi:hypothetical protein